MELTHYDLQYFKKFALYYSNTYSKNMNSFMETNKKITGLNGIDNG